MGSLGNESDRTEPCEEMSDLDIGDTQHLEFDSQHLPYSGEGDVDFFYGLEFLENRQPFRDTLLADDAFETECLNFDGETQQLDFAEETQVMDFEEETEVLVIEGDCCSDQETQVLSDPDDEKTVGASDWDDTVETQVLVDVQDSAETESFKRSSPKTLGNEGIQEEAESKSVGSVHSAGSPGSLRRGFTSIRTASLRASGLSARKKASNDVESKSLGLNGVKSSSGLCDETVDQESDIGKTNECVEELSSDINTKLGRSTARKLLLDDIDIAEDGRDDITIDGSREADLDQAHSYTNGLAGLSYVNSQEPGDFSQANALDFVDQFLKDNVFDFNLDARKQHGGCENQNSVSSAKGTQKLAKTVNSKCSLSKAGVYDWDNRLEDEGGGDFLTRNKELFFGKKSGTRKPLTEPPKPKNLPRMKKGIQQKSKNEEGQSKNMHKTAVGLAHSEPSITARRKVDQFEKLHIRRNLNSDFENQVETEGIDVEIPETVDVGVDTQMAAEAIETLSKGISLSIERENAFEGEDCRGQMEDNMTKSSNVKQNSVRKRVFAADLGVTTRSKRTKGSNNQVENARKQVLKEKATSQIPNTVNITNNLKGVPEKRALKVKDRVKNGARERNVDDIRSSPAKKRRIERKIMFVAPIASRTRNVRRATVSLANIASELSDDLKTETKKLTAADTDGKKRKRNNAKEKSLRLATLRDDTHRDELNCNRSESGKSKGSVEESAKLDLQEQPIIRKRRSSRSVLPTKQSKPTSEHDVCTSLSAENTQPERLTQGTPKEMEKSSLSACTTPVNLRTPINKSSPVCMGDEYYKLSCKNNPTRSSLVKELNSLMASEPISSSPDKGLRKRTDVASVKVLFSHHLDEGIIRQQKKILARLGVTAVSSVLDATHFIADEFMRTRNMLEAIAHGKPVVNHLWLERCGQAGCCIDEKKYLLRDAKKEKELGFSMPDTLAHACQHPLLEGKRVLITPNTMPGVHILSSLVKAVHGQAFERICRSIYKGDKLSDDLLVLSCEEDYEFCVPLLKKGAEVYSSELLLNGIVTQKLEFERHRLFLDQVKKTRSTLWLKKGGKETLSVSRRRV